MLYQNDLHPTPTLHVTSRNWIDIAVPEDIGHALVQIRTTGPGGDGIPAEIHIVRNGGAGSPHLIPQENQGPCRCLMKEPFPHKPTPTQPDPQGTGEGGQELSVTESLHCATPCHPPHPHVPEGQGGVRSLHRVQSQTLDHRSKGLTKSCGSCPGGGAGTGWPQAQRTQPHFSTCWFQAQA